MKGSEMVTDFKSREGGKPVKVETLLRALNAHLVAIGLQPEDYGFNVSPHILYSPTEGNDRLPEEYRWLVAFAIAGGSEGYYIHVAAMNAAAQTYTDLGFAKTYSADNAYALAREAQRFLTAAEWN
jgi:hypothetical protein